MTAAEIRELTDEEIHGRVAELQEELFRLRFRAATQQLENVSLLRMLRRDVARLKTILRERELAQQNG
jgi:large subunit ribosomal protein L29